MLLNHLKNRDYLYFVAALAFILFLTDIMLFLVYWLLGVMALIVYAAFAYGGYLLWQSYRRDLEKYIGTLSHRVKKVGDEALLDMPIGVVLYNGQYQMEWANRFVTQLMQEQTFHKRPLADLSPALVSGIEGDTDTDIIDIGQRIYHVAYHRNDRLLYLFDVTENVGIERLYYAEETVLGIIYLDNYEELTQNMDDDLRSKMNSEVTTIIKQWATKHGIFLKRISSEKFTVVMNQRILQQLQQDKFNVLDRVREATAEENIPLTLSIGIGSGLVPLPELGELAQSGLDIVLGRGGDQVAIKNADGNVTFHGGKTNPVEKRTRVRARVISHALRELILESDQVMIMGHVNPDMDAVGAAIGLLNIVQANDKPGYIVLDKLKEEPGIKTLVEELQKDEVLWRSFIDRDQAVERVNKQTLVIAVDTHNPNFVIERDVLKKSRQVVVIDHHRRGEAFIQDPVLVYLEPYASSASELVTELFEYQPHPLSLSVLEATAMLTGIIVDTKNFTLHTGSRTFDAASNLRSQGADPVLVQRMLRDDIDHYIQRSKLIEHTEVYRDGFAIASNEEGIINDQVLLAQTADTLLSMNGINASFVLSQKGEGVVGISARSLGDVNVQVLMEALGGGGHLTSAAAQIKRTNVSEVVKKLKEIIDESLDEGGETT